MHVRASTNYNRTVLLGAADTEILTLLSALRFINDVVIKLNDTVPDETGQERPCSSVITPLYRPEDFASNRKDVL